MLLEAAAKDITSYQVKRLSQIVFPASARERNMAYFSAYFDESGAPKSPVMVVAGFLSTDAQWSLFEREWKEVLRDYSLDAFHMQLFARDKKPFRGMPEPDKRRLLSRLLAIIQHRAKMGFATVVHVRDFRDVMAGKIRGKVGSPYHLCSAGCQLDVGKWAKENYQIEPIAYFYDAGHKNWKEVAKAYMAEKNNPANVEYRMGAITFEHDNVLVPLQAADIAAYEIWRWLDVHFEGKPKHRRHPFLELIKIPFSIREFDREILLELRNKVLGDQVQPKRTIIHRIATLSFPSARRSTRDSRMRCGM